YESYSKDLIFKLDNYVSPTLADQWYPFAVQSSTFDNSLFAIPFAADALIMVYRPTAVEVPPESFQDVFTKTGPFAFPAADSQGIFPLALYQAHAVSFTDEKDQLTISQPELETGLRFFQQGAITNLMPFWLTQYETDDLSWLAFRENRAQMVVTWASNFLSEPPVGANAAPIPTHDGTPFSVSMGWSWALTSPNLERQEITYELIEFLSEDEFMGHWTQAAGFFPSKPEALVFWNQSVNLALATNLLPNTISLPPVSVLENIGTLFSEAVINILKQELTADEAAEIILDSIP
ncbi:MAG: extracellular solute-binding protein, partial [Chloroflexota bacterium]